MKANLKGPNPTPLEGLLADHVALTWMAALHAESQAAAPNASDIPGEVLRFKRAESAQKRFLAATKTLATLRHLLPAGLVPAQPLKLHQPVRATG